jgi:pilus assembly protein Flp/PilA
MAQAAGFWKQLWRDEAGQDLVEYGLIVGLLALGSIAILKGVATNVATVFTAVGTTLTTAL